MLCTPEPPASLALRVACTPAENQPPQPPPPATAGVDANKGHARVTSGEPNSPDGRASSTTKITASGTSTFRSAPMALT